jgi:hypothetical protein
MYVLHAKYWNMWLNRSIQQIWQEPAFVNPFFCNLADSKLTKNLMSFSHKVRIHSLTSAQLLNSVNLMQVCGMEKTLFVYFRPGIV